MILSFLLCNERLIIPTLQVWHEDEKKRDDRRVQTVQALDAQHTSGPSEFTLMLSSRTAFQRLWWELRGRGVALAKYI